MKSFSIIKKDFTTSTLLLIYGAALLLSGCDKDIATEPSGEGEDKYIGVTKELVLGPETSGFNSSTFTLSLEAPNGSIIKREGMHIRKSSNSLLSLSTGLADGEYRLLYLEYPITDNPNLRDLADKFSTTQFGLGSRIEVKEGMVTILDTFDEEIGLPGKGTADEPYEISSYHSLIKLAQIVNNEENNSLVTKDTHFRQTGKIDMYQASLEIDRRYGWQPIGANSALPFRGHYHGNAITTLIIDRPNSAAVGLFGHVHNAAFYDVKMSNTSVTGNFATGGIVGASLMSSDDRGILTLLNCEVSGSEISGSEQSVSTGALLGAADMHTRVVFQNCTSIDNTVKSSYNAGGLAGGGGLYSSIAFNSCRNTSSVTGDFSGAGGLIGSCDTIQAGASANEGRISGGKRYNPSDKQNSGIGTGGLVGGAGTATLMSCTNSGVVEGYAGVGGLVGSTRVKGSDTEAYMFNNVMLRYCRNVGDVTGTDCVGGITGESQTGTYAVINKGNVTGVRYVGGISGNTSIAVAHNAVNTGKISGKDYVAGIVGKTTFGSLAVNHNYGEVKGTGTHLGGITALAGNNTIIHYCGNFGDLDYTGNGPAGGIVGEIGDPRKWTAMNITECVIGGMECVMGVLGPVMAISGHAIEAFSETLEVVLHITETLTDAGLLYADAALWCMGTAEMIEESFITEMGTELSQEVDGFNNDIKNEMKQIRRNFSFSLADFDHSTLATSYSYKIDDVLDFYESEEGDHKFNEKINLAREEREKQLEKSHQTDEIIHHVVAGVCVVVGTVALIGGAVASGGAAVPFIVAGSVASIAGGLNAITKSCLEFEENVVIISQCVNSGRFKNGGSGATGGLVGRMQDNSILRDCLNTGNGAGRGYPFIGSTGNKVEEQRLLSLASYSTWEEFSSSTGAGRVVWNPKASSSLIKDQWNYCRVKLLSDKSDVVNPATYSDIDSHWKINCEGALWTIPSGNDKFPVPAKSEMTE